MSRIQSIIESQCFDNKPSDVEWTLRKEDVPLIVDEIKLAILNELDDAEHLDDARNYVKEYL